MIIVTGGAGFIGSCLYAALQGQSKEPVVVDRLRGDGKWRNLAMRLPQRLLPPEQLDGLLETLPPPEAVVHLGAISETTARDGAPAWQTYVALSQRLWNWCAAQQVPFLCASSAATYGAAGGEGVFLDEPGRIGALQPLKHHGWSKHAFSLWLHRELACGRRRHCRAAFVDMPDTLGGHYHSYTCADMSRLHEAGYDRAFTPLEQGVRHPVERLMSANRYL